MKYALEDLLRIRTLRENAASEVVTKARRKLEAALKEVERCQRELDDYRVWRVDEEERLYSKVLKQAVPFKELNEIKATVAWLREKELDYHKKVNDAQTASEQARKELIQAQARYREAVKAVQKIEEHKKIWVHEWNLEQEALADKELEEHRLAPYGHDEEKESYW